MYVLSIGGSDSSSGAGVQADIRTCSALGVYCMSIVTAVTAQSASSIIKIKPMDADTVRAQISALLPNLHAHATMKIGMLYSRGIIDVVADALERISDKVNVVLDPVLRAGSGRYLLQRDARSYYVERMLPLASIVTPNIMEAEWLSSIKIRNHDDACRAAEMIASKARSVVIKGGHMHEGDSMYVTDLLYHDGRFHRFTKRRIRGSRLHGAGTILSAAIAAELAKGNDVVSSVKIASHFTHISILNASSMGDATRVPLVGSESMAGDGIISELRRAVDILQFAEGIALLIPESQSNLVFAKPQASSRDDVAGVVGRIVRYEHGYGAGSDEGDYRIMYARAAGPIRYGASRHVADAVLTAMRYDSSIRSAMNIRYDGRLLDVCRGLGMSISTYERGDEPEHVKRREGMSVRWGIEQAILAVSKVPDVVYHRGDWGKEPMIIIFGHDPMDVIKKVRSILEGYRDEGWFMKGTREMEDGIGREGGRGGEEKG
ncbi:MAG: bifunctional hydroxymethylpyrimidine kinase/phosphomethylpyrimidine kinase [Candidatus Nitrosocaldus sp.]|nr:bifunctional hydroxymethylpyrimidine kinase/phosphomethylpyrimidine kinase [Candidatus Nitrosocaldus sp.]MDW8276181.1 bifunctional hydroxymethylpyrimidine kinase/phosphomethylpyrimidine kinase [Candidatus Nitrosocaldus sp.]